MKITVKAINSVKVINSEVLIVLLGDVMQQRVFGALGLVKKLRRPLARPQGLYINEQFGGGVL